MPSARRPGPGHWSARPLAGWVCPVATVAGDSVTITWHPLGPAAAPIGAGDAVRALLARDLAAHASLDDPEAVADLLRELREAGDGDAGTALAARAADAGMFDRFLPASSYPFGREPDRAPSQSWRWQEPAG